jgi:hypothetical protein
VALMGHASVVETANGLVKKICQGVRGYGFAPVAGAAAKSFCALNSFTPLVGRLAAL